MFIDNFGYGYGFALVQGLADGPLGLNLVGFGQEHHYHPGLEERGGPAEKFTGPAALLMNLFGVHHVQRFS